MNDQFPYPECKNCRSFVDGDCIGVRNQIECSHLLKEMLQNIKNNPKELQ